MKQVLNRDEALEQICYYDIKMHDLKKDIAEIERCIAAKASPNYINPNAASECLRLYKEGAELQLDSNILEAKRDKDMKKYWVPFQQSGVHTEVENTCARECELCDCVHASEVVIWGCSIRLMLDWLIGLGSAGVRQGNLKYFR